LQSLAYQFVACARCREHFARCYPITLTSDQLMQLRSKPRLHQPHSFGNDRGATGERFEATSISTPAAGAIRDQSLMPEFPSSAQCTESQLSVDRDAAADSCTN
jgi:hypothetical protein